MAPEKAGPTTATTDLSSIRPWAVVGDWVAEPWSSAGLKASLNGSDPKVLPALAWLIATCTANFMFNPSWAFPPDRGPS